MGVPFVESNQVLEISGQSYGWPNYPDGLSGKFIPCNDTVIINSFWKIPVTLGNRVIGYNYLVATDSTKPQEDAVKILRVKHLPSNTEYGFAIVDTDNIASSSPANQFVYLCDGAGGTLPVMPTVTIPVPIMQSGPQSTATDGTNTFIFAFPQNPNGCLYAIPYPWFNGAAPTTAYVPGAIDTTAEFVTWANSNWSDYGTWTAVSAYTVKLESATDDTIYVEKAGMEVSLTPKHYCLTLNATPDAVNGIKISGTVFPIDPISAGRANRQALIDKIKKYFPEGVFTTDVTNKIDLYTTQLPENITYDGSNVTGLDWSVGACS